MDKYLFKISTRTTLWSSATPKPVYFVTTTKEAAEKWATENLKNGLEVSRITRLAEQIAAVIFTGL